MILCCKVQSLLHWSQNLDSLPLDFHWLDQHILWPWSCFPLHKWQCMVKSHPIQPSFLDLKINMGKYFLKIIIFKRITCKSCSIKFSYKILCCKLQSLLHWSQNLDSFPLDRLRQDQCILWPLSCFLLHKWLCMVWSHPIHPSFLDLEISNSKYIEKVSFFQKDATSISDCN